MIVYVKKKEAGSTCCNPQQVTYGVHGIIQIEENVLDIRRTWVNTNKSILPQSAPNLAANA